MTSRIPTKLLGLALICLLLLGSSGCLQKDQTPAARKKIYLAETMHSVFYAPHYVALNKGYFTKAGLDLELVTENPDVILGSPEGTIAAISLNKAGPKLFSFAQLTRLEGTGLYAREAKPDMKWSDLKGKTIIGCTKGTIPAMVLSHLLKSNQLIPQEHLLVIHNIPLIARPAAFQSGTGHFIQLYSPIAIPFEKADTACLVWFLGQSAGELPTGTYLATGPYLQQNQDAVQKLTDSLYLAQLWMANHSATEISQVIAPSFPELTQQDLTKLIQTYQQQGVWTKQPIPSMPAFDNLQKIMQSTGEIKQSVPANQLVVTHFAQSAVKTVKYVPEQPPKNDAKGK